MEKRYDVKSNFFGDKYIETKDGPAFIRHGILGGDYLETKDGPAFIRHSILGGEYLEMPKKKEISSGSQYSNSYSSITPSTQNIKSSYHSSSSSSRKFIPISSFILAFFSLFLLPFISISEKIILAIIVLFNLIILFIPRNPILGGLLYRFFTATVMIGSVGAFGFALGWTGSMLTATIVAVVYFIVFKLIIAYKIEDV